MTDFNEHVFDELPQLLTGQADRATVAAVSAHLRGCDDCRDELIAAVAAHAALASAARYAPELAGSADLIAGPARAATPSTAPQSVVATPAEPREPLPRPDLSALFAQVRAEVDGEVDGGADDRIAAAGPDAPAGALGGSSADASRRAPVHRRDQRTAAARRLRARPAWLAAAAVLVLGLGGGGTYLAVQGSGSNQASRALSLSAYGDGTSAASGRLIGSDQMALDASALPPLGTGRYYEVWLTNSARTSMAPVGVLDADRKARITVPASEMSSYAAIEVSVQDTSGVGAYSGHSVLRGSYA